MSKLVAVVGPTAVGKSALAMRLAQDFRGEIISADSRQVYRGLDIGTAKPTPAEQGLVPHHLIDIVAPNEEFSLAQYQALAYKTIATVQQRSRLPLLVGGSGLYVWAALEDWQIPRVAPDLTFRRALEERATQGEGTALYAELTKLSPQAAARIDPRNVRRVIRALEITQTGKPQAPVKGTPPFESLIIGLAAPRAELYRRIDARVDAMIARGLVGEVEGLMRQGYGLALPAMSGIGYRQIGLYLTGQLSLAEAIALIKTESHRLVRMQYNWFKPTDPRLHWFDITTEPYAEIEGLVREFIASYQARY